MRGTLRIDVGRRKKAPRLSRGPVAAPLGATRAGTEMHLKLLLLLALLALASAAAQG